MISLEAEQAILDLREKVSISPTDIADFLFILQTRLTHFFTKTGKSR